MDGVVAEALEVVEIAGAAEAAGAYSAAELAYAASKPDPERRLAARLAAKRAASRVLGGGVPLDQLEVLRGPGGPPALRLGPAAERRLAGLGGGRLLVSLTHGLTHAAAAVLLVRQT